MGASNKTDLIAAKSGIVVMDGKRHWFKRRSPRGPHHLGKYIKWLAAGIGGAAALTLLLIVGLHVFIFNRPVAKIGDTTITKAQVDTGAKELAAYAASHPGQSLDGSAADNASDSYILNAALKVEAKKYKVTVTQADLDTMLADQYSFYGSKDKYDHIVATSGMPQQIRLNNENKVYESKLQGNLLLGKQIFYVGTFYDTPFFNRSGVSPELRSKAIADMKAKFLPLFQQRQSKEEIAAKTDVNTLISKGENDITQQFVDGAPTEAVFIPQYANNSKFFNDLNDPTVPEAVSTNDLANKLSKVGEYTDVVTTKAGFIGVMRLEGKTKGTYNSWNDFLNAAKKKYATKSAFSNLGFIGTVLNALGGAVNNLGVQKAAAYSCPQGGSDSNCNSGVGDKCSAHTVAFDYQALNNLNDNFRLAGVNVTEKRDGKASNGLTASENAFGPNCNRGHTGAGDEDWWDNTGENDDGETVWAQTVTTKTSGYVSVKDNCLRPNPDSWSIKAPAGYSFVSASGTSTKDGTSSKASLTRTGAPVWSDASGQFNGSTNHISLYYNIPNNDPTGSVTPVCNDNGTATITYKWNDEESAEWNGWTNAVTKLTTYTKYGSSYTGTEISNDGGWTGHPHVVPGKDGYSTDTESVPASKTDGTYIAWLYAQDIGGDNEYHYIGKKTINCNQPPTGSITWTCQSGTATITKFTYGDADRTTANKVGWTNAYYKVAASSSKPAESYAGDTLSGAGWSFLADGKATTPSPALSGILADGSRSVWLYALDIGGDGNYHQVDTENLKCPPAYSCGSVTLPQMTVNNPITYGVKANVAGTVEPTSKFMNVKITGPNSSVPVTVGYTGTSAVTNPPPDFGFTPTGAGTYTLSYTFGTATNHSAVCTATADANFSPYFNVMGGDIAAGPGFGAGCVADTAAGIFGRNRDSTGAGPFYGAGTQLGALALGNISSFATAQNNDGSDASGSAALIGKGLAFANTTASGTTYGGSYNKTSWCVPDYASEAQKVTPAAGAIDYSTPGTRTYNLTGDQVLSTAMPLQPGVRITVIVTGNVYITSDIKYASYSGVNSIPQFQLLVKGGNIYIASHALTPILPTVSELHGFYDAQPDTNGSGGKIYTCASAINTPFTEYASCNKKLTVYGAFAAKQLVLGRTWGSLYAAGTTPAEPAESFVYDPELWLANLTGPSNSCQLKASKTGCTYQSFTSLPPVL